MLKLNGVVIEMGQFPNGESCMDIDPKLVKTEGVNQIEMKFQSDRDLMGLVYLADYLADRCLTAELLMPYLPYSRMDRKEENRLFTLKSVTRLLNSLNFKKVTIYEPHSEVGIALLDRLTVVNKSHDLAIDLMQELTQVHDSSVEALYKAAEEQGIYLVYPDAGASKRYSKQFKYSKVIECNKERDFNTGRITKLTLNTDGDLTDCKKAIVVDDLCSKGGTFALTAQTLKEKNINEIYLVVTHCEDTIFEGDLLTTDLIKAIITTDSILTKYDDKIKIKK